MKTIVGIVLVLFSSLGYASNAYLCIGEADTGFAFNSTTHQWVPQKFTTNKWMIKPGDFVNFDFTNSNCTPQHCDPKDIGEKNTIIISKFGEDAASLRLVGWAADKTVMYFSDALNVTQFTFNRVNHRFTMWSGYGYSAAGPKEGDDDPYIEIGHCSAVN